MNYKTSLRAASLAVFCAGAVIAPSQTQAQELIDDLVAYWPLDLIQGDKTPDLVSGYDMQLRNFTPADVVTGTRSNAFNFDNSRQTLLVRTHSAEDDLPVNKHPAFTISMWTKVNGPGQVDLRVFSEGNTSVSDPLFNLGTHNGGASGQLDIFIRQAGSTTVNHLYTTQEPFDDQWRHIAFVQQADGTRTAYIDGVADDLVIAPKEAGVNYNFNNTTIGGILRASASHWVTGLIDDVAIWKRALSQAEIDAVRTTGLPQEFETTLPLEINSFTAEFPVVVQGDQAVLRWEASKDATLSISGIGDVTAISEFGVGSTNVQVNQNTTFVLTATRNGQSVTSSVPVQVVSGVSPNWRLVENFDSRAAGQIAGNWLNPEGVMSVVDLGVNKVLGFEDGNDLAAVPLGSMTVAEGERATLFFRLYVSSNDLVNVLGTTFGLTDRPIRFNGDFNGNVGPYLRLERLFEGSTLDLMAHNGVGAIYELFVDVIQPGSVYKIWIDVDNRSFDVVDGFQNGGDVFSVHLQKEGDATRTTLFEDYVSDRDAVTIDPALGAPGPNLQYIFLSAIGAAQGTNIVLFDDFYLSKGAFNSTTPVPASSFVPGEVPTEINITSFNRGANSFTLEWTAQAGITYTVQKKTTLDGQWVPVVTGHPAGGAVGGSANYTDSAATTGTAFYRVSQSP